MEEAKKEDMSTEQILSSIRNILTDENSENVLPLNDEDVVEATEEMKPEVEQVAEPETEDSQEEISVEEASASEDEDIFDLSPVMVVRPYAEGEKTETISEDPYELSSDQETEDVLDLSSIDVVEEPEEVLDLGADEVVDENEILNLSSEEVVEESQEEKAEETSIETEVEPEAETKIEIKEPVVVQNIQKVEAPVLEDVASNILSAFSNIFNNYAPEKKAQPQKVVGSAYENNELKAEVQKTIESWVVKNIDADLNIKGIVNEEIALQVRVWLDENLPNLIQSSINQELERVMVKVDKAQ